MHSYTAYVCHTVCIHVQTQLERKCITY